MLFHQADHLCKLKIKETLKEILMERDPCGTPEIIFLQSKV